MKKTKSHAFNKDCYLLGKGRDGDVYWLEASTFDCNWYWSIGYVETYTNQLYPNLSKDISSHQHFDGLFNKPNKNWFDSIKLFFSELVLSDSELWKLCEIMKSLYILKDYSDMLHIGGAHYTSNPCSDIIKCNIEYDRINKVVIPALLKELYELLS